MFSRRLSSLPISGSSISALENAGFEQVDDLGELTAEQLSEELKIPAFLCEEILRASRKISPALTQSATSLLHLSHAVFPVAAPVDSLLEEGGLKKGYVLELSGPPGSPKELVLLNLVKSVVSSGEEVLFLDTQNMGIPSTLRSALKDIPGAHERVHYVKCFSLPELIAFMHNIPDLLNEYPKTSLLVLNTFSFLFHATPLNAASKASLLDQVKTILARVCASRHLSVAVTVQLATKMIGIDGAGANFDTAKKVLMVPQLGGSYLPSSKSYRLVFIPDSPTTGVIRLLTSPSRPSERLKEELTQERYEMIDGKVCRPTMRG